jgi:hypothetical protein
MQSELPICDHTKASLEQPLTAGPTGQTKKSNLALEAVVKFASC